MSCADFNPMPEAAGFRRDPSEVMRLSRMGSAHPTRLSFLRVLLRRLGNENWRFDRPVWEVDGHGVGHAVYRAAGPTRTYSLVAFAHDLPDHMRSDRVIATAWDATFALFDGMPGTADIERLRANVPLQEAGRVTPSELTLSRANRSVRLFAHVVERLAKGEQPDIAEIDAVGYLMRTTAVYGAGKFGAADRATIAGRPELAGPFQAEMLTVWLIRWFTVDIVEHLARAAGGDSSTRLAPALRKRLGVGNSTGLGMAPFLVRHPVLLNNWMMVREEALARVCSLPVARLPEIAGFKRALTEAQENARHWHSDHPLQQKKLEALRRDFKLLTAHVQSYLSELTLHPWDGLWLWGETALSVEGQEALVALLLEPYGALVDGLADCMSADEDVSFAIDGSMPVDHLRHILTYTYSWAISRSYASESESSRFWYVSEEKLEPRLGERYAEEGAERELPLDTARAASQLWQALARRAGGEPVARFLLAHPEHRHTVRRAQIAARHPFAEIQDNLIGADMLPIDLLRCKLAFLGANRFDPRSDRWVRISLFQGMPYPDEL